MDSILQRLESSGYYAQAYTVCTTVVLGNGALSPKETDSFQDRHDRREIP